MSTAAPATYDATGYGALVWTEIGSITKVGNVVGRTYSTATLSTVSDAQDREKKGSFKLPNAQFECAWIENDAGQVIVNNASKDNSVPSFKLLKQDGTTKRYFTAQVLEYVENLGQSNDAVKGSLTLLRQTDTITSTT
ncbi:hypothetical protein [Massilia sp. 9096]|uniref:hypothetical protein n=1 Tax=Massilia sp. 9096 TaxID=1500894 RepID=UPI000B22D8C8|nr:hypothetical protein [Massilia sp. 9096]